MRRREFLGMGALAALPAAPRKKIAALCTTYHVRSHADNFITRFLEGYWINERYYPPPCDVVSLYMDQVLSLIHICPAGGGQSGSAAPLPVRLPQEHAL